MSNLDIYWKKIPFGTGGVNLNVSPLRQSVLDHHEQILNKFFDDFFGNRKQFIHSNTSYPKMDIIEDSHYFRVRCAVPGLSKEDLDVALLDAEILINNDLTKQYCTQNSIATKIVIV